MLRRSCVGRVRRRHGWYRDAKLGTRRETRHGRLRRYQYVAGASARSRGLLSDMNWLRVFSTESGGRGRVVVVSERVVGLVSCGVCAAYLPHFALLKSISGGLSGTFIAFVLPIAMYLKLRGRLGLATLPWSGGGRNMRRSLGE